MLFTSKDDPKLTEIPINSISPNRLQPRKLFKESELYSLAESITNNGILQPLTVKKIAQNEYELIAGERRLRASAIAGLTKVPCIVMKCSDRQSAVFALIENLQRADLNMFEEALAIRRLILECSLTQDRVARQLGKTQSTIANKLRLLRLDDDEQQQIISANLTERHARLLLKFENNDRKILLSKIISQNLNVKQAENVAKNFLGIQKEEKTTNKPKVIIKDVRIFMNTLSKAVDTMKLSGINAKTEKTESEEYIEYSIKIPKTNVYKKTKNTEDIKTA